MIRDENPPAVWLVDLFETLVTVDWGRMWTGLAEIAGVPVEPFRSLSDVASKGVMTGAVSMDEVMATALVGADRAPEPALVAALVAADRELLIANATVFPDAEPFLERLRAMNRRIVIVSNCAQNAGPMADALGLTEQVDRVVLSCEIGAAKPSPAIFAHALGLVGASADDAVLVDDQRAYCEGAEAVGMRSIWLCRDGAPTTQAGPLVVARGLDRIT